MSTKSPKQPKKAQGLIRLIQLKFWIYRHSKNRFIKLSHERNYLKSYE